MRQIDPELTAKVGQFLKDPRSLAALVTVGHPNGAPVNLAEAVELLVLQASNESRAKPSRVVLFVRLNAFAIEAPASFLAALLQQDLVRTASLGD